MEGPEGGEDEERGMIPRAVEQVFQTASNLKEKGWEVSWSSHVLGILRPQSSTVRPTLQYAQPHSQYAQPRSQYAQPRSQYALHHHDDIMMTS